MKKNQIQMLLYTLTKKIMEVQRYMLNPFDIILFYKVMGWFDVEPRKPRFNFLYQHILCGRCIFVNMSHKCV
jgi:hypothetical protein